MLTLMPVAASAAPHDRARCSTSVRGNVYERGSVYQRGNRDSFRDRDSFAFRARHGHESRSFFSRGFSFGPASAWRGDRQ